MLSVVEASTIKYCLTMLSRRADTEEHVVKMLYTIVVWLLHKHSNLVFPVLRYSRCTFLVPAYENMQVRTPLEFRDAKVNSR